MAYLNLDLDYFDHPKTKRLVGLLGRGSDGLPIRLWCYCGKYHAENGDLTGYLAQDLESLIGWWGQPGKAVEALIKFGFLDQTATGFKVHDWEDINGHIAAFKARAQAGAKEKWRRVKAEADAQAMLKQSLSNAVSNALTSLTDPEENKKNKTKTVLGLVDAQHLMPAKPDPENLQATRDSVKKVSEFAFLEDGTYPFLKLPVFDVDWTAWLDMRKKQKWDNGPRAMVLALNKLHGWPLEKAVLALQLSIERCYRGIFEPKEEGNGQNGSRGGSRRESRADRLDRDATELLRELGGAQGGNPPADQPDFFVVEPGTAGA